MRPLLLDTNSLVFLHHSGGSKFRKKVINQIEYSHLYFSPISLFELEYIFDKKRINTRGDQLVSDLQSKFSLSETDSSFSDVIKHSRDLSWTKDPFDRLIIGDAIAINALLVTSDRLILKHFNQSIW